MSEQTPVVSLGEKREPTTAAGRALVVLLAESDIRWPDEHTRLSLAVVAKQTAKAESEARAAALADGQALREAVLSGPPVRFPNLPTQPTGPDVLDAIAAWMDKIDARDNNPHHEVQDHLRSWAVRLRAALDRVGAPQ